MDMYREIPLTKGQVAVVDADLFDWLNQWKWRCQFNEHTQSYYAFRLSSRKLGPRYRIWMHREILGLSREDKRHGDHRESGMTLLNTRGNLRIATTSQNCMNGRRRKSNTTGYKGTYPASRGSGFIANVQIEGKQVYLGTRKTVEE